MKIGFIGVGNQATAMLRGMARTQSIAMQDVYAFDIDTVRLEETARELGFHACTDAASVLAACDAVAFAVKPYQMQTVLEPLAAQIAQRQLLVISMAAGTPIEKLEACLQKGTAVARIMPNQNAAIAQSITAHCTNAHVTQAQTQMLRLFCASFGEEMELDEAYFSAFFVLAGAGPAFAFLFIDQLTRAGVKIGMSRALAQKAAVQTVLGSAQLVLESGVHPQELIDRVCSPGGITIAGITALQEHGFEHAVTKAVESAYYRDKSM